MSKVDFNDLPLAEIERWLRRRAEGVPLDKGIISAPQLATGAVGASALAADAVTAQAILYSSVFPESVTIPTSPENGQLWVYPGANGVRWLFQYNAASVSAYKWEFIGGSPLYSIIGTTGTESTASLTYVALTTAGPAIALPFAGDYDIDHGCHSNNNVTNAGTYMSYDIGGTAATDTDGLESYQNNADAITAGTIRTNRKTGLSAVTLTAKYRANVGGTAAFWRRWMRVRPVRVG